MRSTHSGDLLCIAAKRDEEYYPIRIISFTRGNRGTSFGAGSQLLANNWEPALGLHP
jgi:hypothetical protein